MKKFLAVLFVAVFGLIAQAQEKKAEIKFETEEIDYGTIKKGADGVRVFEFTNVGEVPLIISNAYSSCGCTVPSYPQNEPIAPGQKQKIEVKYDTNRVGPIRKSVTVISNASNAPTITLRIKGEVTE